MGGNPDIREAILLIGPTGSGKTPLGNVLETEGIAGVKCHHFDFGENLRGSIDTSCGAGFLNDSEYSVIRRVLEEGALLEDGDFAIAEKILLNFLNTRRFEEGDLLLLNGLPRHKGQAHSLKKIVDVGVVINLLCMPETVVERISGNSGGDRTGRIDDSLAEVQKKLILFDERTKPLLAYYEEQGADVVEVNVGSATGPREIVLKIDTKYREMRSRYDN